MQILVLGMHRSGTSVVAHMLNLMGAYFGPAHVAMQAKADNPSGFWEREDVVSLNDALLAESGSIWDAPTGFRADAFNTPDNAFLLDTLRSIVHELDQHRPWMIKDPRLCITAPLWLQALDNPVGVVVYRNPLDIAKSLRSRNGTPVLTGIALWEYYLRTTIQSCAAIPLLYVNFHELCANPVLVAQQLHDDLVGAGVSNLTSLRTADIRAYFDAGLVHGDSTDMEVSSLLNCGQRQLLRSLVAKNIPDEAGTTPSLHTSTELLEYIRQTQFNQTQFKMRIDKQSGQIESLDNRIADFQRQSVRSDSWLEELDNAINLHRRSATARYGRIPVSVLRGLTFRRPAPSADDHIETILNAFRATKGMPAIPPVDQRPPSSRAALLLKISRAAARNPTEMLRLLRDGKLLTNAIRSFISLSGEEMVGRVNNRLLGFGRHRNRNPVILSDIIPAHVARIQLPYHDQPDISIIIPAYNNYKITLKCLDSIARHTGEVRYEVIIADDFSNDQTAEIATQIENLRVVRQPANVGFLHNCNQAADHAIGRYLLFLNNDTNVQPDWLAPMLGIAERDNRVGIVGSMLLNRDGSLQEAGGIVWKDGSGANYGRDDDPERPEYNYVKQVDYVSGACLMVRREVWTALGGFDTRFAPAYYEDTDLAFATRKAGYKAVYQPRSHVVHFEGVSHGTSTQSGIKRFQSVNQKKISEKWHAVLDMEHYTNGKNIFLARDRSGTRKTILVIDHYVPHFDRDAGSRSTFMYLKLFVEMGLNVKFLGDNFCRQEPYTQALQQMGIEVIWGDWYAQHWKQWLTDVCDSINYIYLHRPHITEKYIDAIRSLPCQPRLIYFGHDLHYLRSMREYAVTKSSIARSDADAWRKREYSIFSKVDTVYYPSQAEIDEIHRNDPSINAKVIPLYFYDDVYDTAPRFDARRDILFVGGFNHPPNVDAVRWFVNEIFPLVSTEIPEMVLYVVGSKTPEEFKRLASHQIKFLGTVSDQELDTLYRRVRLSVVPLRFGAGIKGKILESVYKGVPVITTAVGAEGIVEAERFLAIAQTITDFANTLVQRYNDSVRWQEMRASGVEVLTKHYTREAVRKAIAADISP